MEHCLIIKAKKKDRVSVRDYLAKQVCVNSLFKINNGYDYLADLVCRNVKEVEEFVEALRDNYSLAEVKIYHVIDEIQRETFLSDPMHIGHVGL